MNRTGSTIFRGLLLATSGLVGSTVLASTAAMAGGGPTGGTVAVGSATIVNSSPTQTVVNQSSQKALINWNSFSIPGGSSVQFNQPNSKSLTVNRVTGANASIIDGQILATGNVWLINANGVLFGKGSQINVGALLATTSDLSDDDFKNGNYNFKPATNPNAAVVNKGTITAGANGSVVLSAPQVSNEGLIHADFGTVVLGGANAFTVDMTGDNLLRYEITAPVTSAPKDGNGNLASALVSNAGTIEAAGGHVMMTARAARNIENNVINNTGMVEATSVSAHNGVIDLDAGPDGTVNDSGTLNVSGTAQGQTGGAVNVTGSTVNVADGAKIDASGNAGGGTIQIGGGLHGGGTLAHAQTTIIGKATISADATGNGNGGTVAVWSDGDTSFAGSISAKGGANGGNGGQVETSGHNLGVAASAKVDTSAPLGLTGDWLLDPTYINIVSCGTNGVNDACGTSNIAPSTITTALVSTNVTLEATQDITIENDVVYSSSNSLSFLAEGNIYVGANVQNAGTGAVTAIAGWSGDTTDPSLLTTGGKYGNNSGAVYVTSDYDLDPDEGASFEASEGEAHAVAIGSHGGLTTVAGADVQLLGYFGTAQIGYAGAGGGDIGVFATDAVTLAGGADATLAVQIGNGATFGSAAGGGNVSINAGSILTTGSADIAGNSASLSTFGGGIGSSDDSIDVEVNYLAIPDAENDGSAADAFITSSGPISIGYGGNGIQLNGGDLALSAGGAVSQTEAILVGGADITATGGDITLNNASNKIDSATLSATAGNVTIYDGTDLELDGATVGGNFTALTTGNLTITDSVQLNSGSLVAVAGWDGTTTNFTSLSASSTAYGRNSGDIVIGGEDANEDIFVGSKTGTTLIAGANVSVLAVNGNATIGYGGPGGGNITVWAKNDITAGSDVEDPEYENYLGSIGNGDGFTAGNVTGDIAITAGGYTTIVENNGGYVGNYAADGSSSTGNVTIITNSGDLDGGYFQDDLNGGNVFVGFTGTTGTYDLGGLGTYNSSHTFTWAAAASLDVEGNVQNTGSGAVNLIAGWDGHTTDLGSLTNAGVYGNNGGNLSIFAGEGNIIVGSKSGATTVEGAEVDVGANSGDTAQIGYHGAGATGAITVLAVNDINITGGEGSAAQIGNGGANVTGSVGGNITVSSSSGSINIGDNGGGSLMLIGNVVNSGAASGNIAVSTNGGSVNITAASAGEIAQIGNLGFSNASETGNISINTHGHALTVSSSSSNGSVAAVAHIGNWTDGDTTLGSSGNITIAAGALALSATGHRAFAEIGNGDFHAGHTGTLSGNIAINAASLSLNADNTGGSTQARIGNLGDGTVSGDITVNTTGSMLLTAANGSLANIGDLSATVDSHGNPAQGAGSGNITVQAGGSISLMAQTGGAARIESGGFASGNVSVTASGNITLSAASASPSPNVTTAFIGSYGAGNDAVNVSVTSLSGAVVLNAAAPGGQVGIGTQTNGLAGNISGQVRVSAANTTNGNITVSATGSGAAALIGNDGYGSAVSGDITVLAGNALQIVSAPGVSLIGNTDSNFGFSSSVSGTTAGNVTVMGGTIDGIENSIENDIVGGNVTIGITKASTLVTIDDNITYSSANALTVLAAGSIILSGSIQNSGTGNITLLTGWNSSVAPSSVLTTVGAYGNNNGSLTIGGSTATGNSAVGSAGGTTTILTKNLNVTAVNGVAALGYAGPGHGNIVVSALGNIAVVGASSSVFAEIGNVGVSNQTVSGNITIADAGSFTLTNGILGNAVLGNAAATGNTGLTAASFAVSGTSLLSGSSADITLTGAGAGLGSAGNALNTTVGAIAVQTNNGSAFIAAPKNTLSIGIGSRGVNLGTGSLTLTTGGAITQTAAIKAAAINLSATSGPISLANAANAFGTIVLSTNGSATIGDSSSLTVAGATVGGDLTLLSKGNLIFTQSVQLLKGALVAVAGWNGSGTTAASGVYGNNGGSITIGGSGASGGVAVGSASGATTLAGAGINLQATNGYAQIGYHGGGSGAIKVLATNGVTLAGGNSSNFFAQIGDGGFNVTGSSSAPITVQAGGDVALNAGAGQEAYAQIGNGGAESNSNSSGYSETGLVTVSGETVTLNAGGGTGSYAQIGHGGYKSGQSLNGIATLGGDISVNAVDAIHLVGGGNDAYAQIGHGGDFLNDNAANGASGALSGNITVNVVAASTSSGGDPLTLTAGTGVNSYTQIGNGGQGENSPASGATVTFDIGGNVTVADITLTGSNTGANGYSQVGNGDASKTGTGNVSGQVILGSGTDITDIPGSAPGASTGLGNSTGTGTVTGTVLPTAGVNAGTQGSVASITQNPVGPTSFSITTVTVTPENAQPYQFSNNAAPQGPTPLEQLSDQSDQEGKTASDSVAQSVGQSLGDGKTIYVTSKTLIPGMLKQIVTLTRNSPNGIPPADEDYSSWGNEALWRW